MLRNTCGDVKELALARAFLVSKDKRRNRGK